MILPATFELLRCRWSTWPVKQAWYSPVKQAADHFPQHLYLHMQILLTAATAMEIGSVSDFVKQKTGKANQHAFSSLITGVGLVPTTYALMRRFANYRPDLVIQAGVAGSFTPGKIGDVVAIHEDAFADMGVFEEERFKTIFDLNLGGRNDFPYSNGYLQNPYQALLSLSGLEQLRGISVNTITTAKKTIEWYQQNEKAAVESMEGAALHYTCLMEKIPFIQVRAICNEVGERDKANWKLRDAVIKLNEALISFIQQLNNHHGDQHWI